MAEKKISKAEKTEAAIITAFFRLAEARPELLPNVSEVCAELDIYRSTFYNYFTSIEDLMNASSSRMLEEMREYYRGMEELGSPVATHSEDWQIKNINGALVYVLMRHTRVNKVLLNPKLNHPYRRKIFRMIADGVRFTLKDKPESVRETLSVMMASAILSAISHWLNARDMSVGEFSRFLGKVEQSMLDAFNAG